MDINDFDKCPKCGGGIYISGRKVSRQWACANPECGYSSNFLKAEVAAKVMNWAKNKVVFDDKDRNIWMRVEVNGEPYLFRWRNNRFVFYKRITQFGLNPSQGYLIEKIDEI